MALASMTPRRMARSSSMAELLSHLGLREALNQLSVQALRSSDPDVREVGEDFAE